MPILNLRNISRLHIQILANESWNFSMTFKPPAGSTLDLTGSSAEMTIRKGVNGELLHTLTVGDGLTITGSDKFLLTPPVLPQGEYYYQLEIETPSGELYRVQDKISSTYEWR